MTSRDGNVITATTSGESVSGGPAAKMEPQVLQSGHEALYGSWHPMMTAGGVQYADPERCQADPGGEGRVPAAAYDVMKEKYKTNCDPQARTAHEAHHQHHQHQQLYAGGHQAAFDGPFSRAAVPTKLDVRDPGNAKGQQSQSQMAASSSFPVTNENYSQHVPPQQSTSDAAAAYHGNGESAAESSAAAAAAAAAAFAAAQHQMQQFDVMQNCYAAASMQYQQQHGQHAQGKGIYSWMKPYGTGKNRLGH